MNHGPEISNRAGYKIDVVRPEEVTDEEPLTCGPEKAFDSVAHSLHIPRSVDLGPHRHGNQVEHQRPLRAPRT
eukprot:5372626-Pyramimonas_sp.AAC.1